MLTSILVTYAWLELGTKHIGSSFGAASVHSKLFLIKLAGEIGSCARAAARFTDAYSALT
jgi:hypothetical protein